MKESIKNILIIGSGGREHAIGATIKSRHPHICLYFAKGNGGSAQIGENLPFSSIPELAAFSIKNNIDLTVVGSEELLAQGISDEFTRQGLAVFGPHKAAAMLESSKAFAKEFMRARGIKTALHQTFSSPQSAQAFIKSDSIYPIVIKADGLAAGKGVHICHSEAEALRTVDQFMSEKILGEAGSRIVIEEYLEGFEASVLCLYNGEKIYPLLVAKDHKALLDGNQGPNTGGMGAVAPHPLTDEAWLDNFYKNILLPTERGLREEKLSFAGAIFFGLMSCAKGIYLLEYNMRLGDPETQAILPLLESDFLSLIADALQGKALHIEWKNKSSCCVVLASEGYPLRYEKGALISGLDKIDCPYFIAGAEEKEGRLYTSGGRVLNIVGVGDSLDEARKQAYLNAEKIDFKGKYYRKDIGMP